MRFELLQGGCQDESADDIERRCRAATLYVRTKLIEAIVAVKPGVLYELVVPVGTQLSTIDDIYYYQDHHLGDVSADGLPAGTNCKLGLRHNPPAAIVHFVTHNAIERT